jgi:hypothetical protein
MDISTFLGSGTVPDKEKPDGHFDVLEEPLQHELCQPHTHRQTVLGTGARHRQPIRRWACQFSYSHPIRIVFRILRIRKFVGLQDPDPDPHYFYGDFHQEEEKQDFFTVFVDFLTTYYI